MRQPPGYDTGLDCFYIPLKRTLLRTLEKELKGHPLTYEKGGSQKG
jgi:hypothetical protein